MEKEHLQLQSGYFKKLARKATAEGHAEGLRNVIRALLEARGMRLSTAQSRELDRCADLALLDDWVKRAARASTVAEIFAPPQKRSTRAQASRRADAGPARTAARSRARR